ncbi:MAG: 4'-phosphopantetheinyl transferase superfamily protein [Rhodobacter sp.]|nr:4'-phosphopantetheinyl transferase superfamily protein [Rhodobacter sp.]
MSDKAVATVLLSCQAWRERLPALRPVLTARERDDCDRVRLGSVREQKLLARAALRLLGGALCGVSPRDLNIAPDANGKPQIAGQRLTANYAHAGDCVALALAGGRAVGVDIEAVDRKVAHLDLARSQFALAEFEALAALPEADRARSFTACWTRKEAFIKALGLGLKRPLSSFSVSVPASEPPRLVWSATAPEEPDAWAMRTLACPDGYFATLAYARAGDPAVVSEHIWSPETAPETLAAAIAAM